MHGPDDRVVPGNAASTQPDKPFRMLSQFGTSFLSKFQLSLAPYSILESISFIDTPGVLSGEKQRVGRSYDFPKVCEWFAEKADVILLLFDAHKLDISDEYKRVIASLKNNEEKIRVVLNKADLTDTTQLIRVYGALMYSLSRVLRTPEVPRVYFVSLYDESIEDSSGDIIRAELKELLKDLYDLPRFSAVRKINDLVKRCRYARVHAHLISYIRKEMPVMWGKTAKQAELLSCLPDVFTKIQKQTGLPPGDFPDINIFREALVGMDFGKFSKYSARAMEKLESAMNEDLPKLMLDFPQGPAVFAPPVNPFQFTDSSMKPDRANISAVNGPSQVSQPNLEPKVSANEAQSKSIPEPTSRQYSLSLDEVKRYEREFYSMNPTNAVLSGSVIKTLLKDVDLTKDELATIWFLSDRSADGFVDLDEFIILMKLIEVRVAGGAIPSSVPEDLLRSLDDFRACL